MEFQRQQKRKWEKDKGMVGNVSELLKNTTLSFRKPTGSKKNEQKETHICTLYFGLLYVKNNILKKIERKDNLWTKEETDSPLLNVEKRPHCKRVGRVKMRSGAKWTCRTINGKEGGHRHEVGKETDATPGPQAWGNPQGKDKSP